MQANWLATDAAALHQAERLDCPMARLLAETRQLLGADPFAHYDFLIALDDRLPGPGGIEHRESSEVFLPADFLVSPASYLPEIDVLAHELIHAWNGMQRVPADLWAPTPNTPMRNGLLWMYEGQTEFWSRVIAARAGLRSVQDTLDLLAIDAASVETRAGRAWKNLADSALDPAMLNRGLSMSWRDWQRREDYYVEGVLLWLAIDGRLRERSDGHQGLDDFAMDFFGRTTPASATRTYTTDDIARTLSRRVPGDWQGELQQRLQGHDNGPVLDGLASHGWRLAYRDQPTPMFQQREKNDGITDLGSSIGATVTAKGIIKSVSWQGPAFRAGLVPGMRLLQVGDSPFSPAALVDAVARTRDVPDVPLKVQVDDSQETLRIDWHGGLRYPVLERLPAQPDGLKPLLVPRAPSNCAGTPGLR
ncbi:MAG: hypothetical protein HY020_16710 [Burkholderiales bacterium]|nr:hypothetical protein [Burkholderiales bacterium]